MGTRSRAVTQGRASPGTRQGLRGLYMLVWPCRGRLLAVEAGSHSHGHARAGHSPLCATHTSKWRVCACRCVLRAPQGWWREPVPALAPRAARVAFGVGVSIAKGLLQALIHIRLFLSLLLQSFPLSSLPIHCDALFISTLLLFRIFSPYLSPFSHKTGHANYTRGEKESI